MIVSIDTVIDFKRTVFPLLVTSVVLSHAGYWFPCRDLLKSLHRVQYLHMLDNWRLTVHKGSGYSASSVAEELFMGASSSSSCDLALKLKLFFPP